MITPVQGVDLTALALVGPESALPLHQDQPWSLSDGQTRWPVVEGIPFLRTNREPLRREALGALDAGNERHALMLLLADQDDYARIAPPDESSLEGLIASVARPATTLRDAMAALRFGPVADYFAYRWSSPTYLSGLALLERFAGDAAAGPVLEVACGIGHYLRDLAARGRACAGVDVVFSKLWLARRFVVPAGVPLICGDVAAGLPIAPSRGPCVVFCHDAFYFLPTKAKVIAGLRRVIGPGGRILIGHAHNRDFDQGGVSGEPLSPGEYADLLPGCTLFDDAELARSVVTGVVAPTRSVAELAGVEAVALVAGADPADVLAVGRSLLDPIPGASLQLNPLLTDRGGMLEPAWPSSRFEAEYAAASRYLRGEPVPSRATLQAAAADGAGGHSGHPEVDRLARRRILLDLPGRW